MQEVLSSRCGDDARLGIGGAADDEGNQNGPPTNNTFNIDNTPPDTVVDSGPPDETSETSVTFAFHATEVGSSFRCQLNGGEFNLCSSPVTYEGLREGEHSFRVQATDRAGNSDPTPFNYIWSQVPEFTCGGLVATIVGTEDADTLRGTPGDDVIVALGGDDVVVGLAGDEVICAGFGADRVYGGSGNDTVIGQAGLDKLFGGPGRDLIVGGTGHDLLVGGKGNDLAFGGAGNDRLVGGPGRDRLVGGPGNDRLLGNGGRDRLVGGIGDDDLTGGRGSDVLNCGPGSDTADVEVAIDEAVGCETNRNKGNENLLLTLSRRLQAQNSEPVGR